MSGVSDLTKFKRVLAKHEHNRLSPARLAQELGDRWTAELVKSKARKFNDDPTIPIFLVIGGVQYLGTEVGKLPGIYSAMHNGIVRVWAPRRKISSPLVLPQHHHVKVGSGEWRNPDLVLVSNRRSDAAKPLHYHSIEAEQANGFSIKSVYQAYEQGRGADFSWVFFAGPRPLESHWKRIVNAAADIGVGVVHAAKANVPSQWKTELAARERDYSVEERSDFLSICK